MGKALIGLRDGDVLARTFGFGSETGVTWVVLKRPTGWVHICTWLEADSLGNEYPLTGEVDEGVEVVANIYDIERQCSKPAKPVRCICNNFTKQTFGCKCDASNGVKYA